MAGGAVSVVLGVLVVFLWHSPIVEATGVPELAGYVVFRGVEAALVWGGAWLCVRGWNGGPVPAEG
ncbi:hypothetical protein IPZ58_32995 [Streptomyces roseoverticillatus]|uniref:hypothetical protein n=1 Tax=Streptomyces roseoverticillatus TaxID=66429 RepID=UPI001F26AD24|nr:hypothetical protein [Streptomyces roseoverticillatus]MCF3106349.1 hypothetical protein [Streptomyces roseoverticillatus]